MIAKPDPMFTRAAAAFWLSGPVQVGAGGDLKSVLDVADLVGSQVER